ncbi:MAG: hypothetical protein WC521_00980 [Bdellovibrionales bacterium]|jgi:hypothetical protein
MRKSLTFSDYFLLNTIQKMYEGDYINRDNNKTAFYIRIDCEVIAKFMNVDPEMVFQRLYYHLNKKYGYTENDKTKVEFFAFEIGGVRHCINYPYLCAVLATMEDDQKELRNTKRLAWASLVISILGIFVQYLMGKN